MTHWLIEFLEFENDDLFKSRTPFVIGNCDYPKVKQEPAQR